MRPGGVAFSFAELSNASADQEPPKKVSLYTTLLLPMRARTAALSGGPRYPDGADNLTLPTVSAQAR